MNTNQLNSEQAFQYLCELLSEYMKTLPAPVRIPVTQTINQCTAVIVNDLTDLQTMKNERDSKVTKIPKEAS
jgi:hypothetical protein